MVKLMWRGFLRFLLIGLMSGCGANYSSIFREANLDEDQTLITDATQRVITNTKVTGDDIFYGRVRPNRIVCSEPSPDVANAISQAVTASIEATISKGPVTAGGSGAFGLSTANSIAQLGERLATIQLLRDELSDLCRSYANGAVSQTTYTLRLSKLDKKMVTLLLGEMSAGAFGRTLAIIGGLAGSNTGQSDINENLIKSRQELITASKDVQDQELEVQRLKNENAPEDQQIAAQLELDKRKKIFQEKLNILFALERAVASTYAKAGIGEHLGKIQANTSNTELNGIDPIITIQSEFLNDDELGTVLDACITSMDLIERPTSKEGEAKVSLIDEESYRKQLDLVNERREKLAGTQAEVAQIEETLAQLQKSMKIFNEDKGLLRRKSELLRNKFSRYEEIERKPEPVRSEKEQIELEDLRQKLDTMNSEYSDIKGELEEGERMLQKYDALIETLGPIKKAAAEAKARYEGAVESAQLLRENIVQPERELQSNLGKFCRNAMGPILDSILEQSHLKAQTVNEKRLQSEIIERTMRLNICSKIFSVNDLTKVDPELNEMCKLVAQEQKKLVRATLGMKDQNIQGFSISLNDPNPAELKEVEPAEETNKLQ